MARTIEHKKLESPTARAKLPRGRNPHYQLLAAKAALGWQRKEGAAQGRWLLRRYLGGDKYSLAPLGLADDDKTAPADGVGILNYAQAKDAAMALLAQGNEGVLKGQLTVRKAYARYVDFLRHQGKATVETERRGALLILPELGDLLVADLTSERLRRWHAGMVERPAMLRSKKVGKKNTKPPPTDPEKIRQRRATANRVLTMLRASLNHAFDEGLVASNAPWGRRLKPFRDVGQARLRYLTVAEAKRLLNAAAPDFRQLVQAALETGCRYGELMRLRVEDFNPDAGTLTIRRSKSGKSRAVVLGPEGAAFFTQITAGRRGDEILLRHTSRIERALEVERARLVKAGKNPDKARVDDDGAWRESEQGHCMRATCANANITPRISFHGLRHTWASLAVMAGVPLLVVARNLGHRDSRMVEVHYAHLAESYVTETIRKNAPRFGFVADKKVVKLKPL